MTDEHMLTPEYQAKVRIARRITIGIAVVVGIIFMGTFTLGYLHYRYDMPVSELLTGERIEERRDPEP